MLGHSIVERRLSAGTPSKIVAAMRLQYRRVPGLRYRLGNFWSQWPHPYVIAIGVPPVRLPIAILG